MLLLGHLLLGVHLLLLLLLEVLLLRLVSLEVDEALGRDLAADVRVRHHLLKQSLVIHMIEGQGHRSLLLRLLLHLRLSHLRHNCELRLGTYWLLHLLAIRLLLIAHGRTLMLMLKLVHGWMQLWMRCAVRSSSSIGDMMRIIWRSWLWWWRKWISNSWYVS